MIAGIVTQKVFDSILCKDCPSASLCDFFELRYDTFKRDYGSLAAQLKEKMPDKPIIGTIRLPSDGGELSCQQSKDLIRLWSDVMHGDVRPEWVDCELENAKYLVEMFKTYGEKILISYHDWTELFPMDKAKELLGAVARYNADGVKLAVTGSGSFPEVVNFIHCLDYFELSSAFVMGTGFTWTRYQSLREGATLAYASLDGSNKYGTDTVENMARALKKSPV